MQLWVRRAFYVALLFAVIAIGILYALNWQHMEVVLPIAGVFILCGFFHCRRRYRVVEPPIMIGGACRADGVNINQLDKSWCDGPVLNKDRRRQLHPDRNFDCQSKATIAFQDAESMCKRLDKISNAPSAAPSWTQREPPKDPNWKSWDDHMREKQNARDARDASDARARERERERQRPSSVLADLAFAMGVMGEGAVVVGELAFEGAGVLGELAFAGIGALGKLALAGTVAGAVGIANGMEGATKWMLGD